MSGLLLQNCFHVQPSAEGAGMRGVDILIQGDTIAAIGPRLAPVEGARVIDCSRHVVVPGFVNTHHHFFQTLTRNLPAVQNAKLFDWLVYLYEIWKNLAGTRLAPRREEITLGLVRSLTPWLWTADVIDDGADFRFRLAGDRVAQFYGQPITGSPLSEFPNAPFFERVRQMLTSCVEQRQPIAFGPVRSSREGKEHWVVEAVVLPLSEDGKTINCLIGALELWPAGANGAAH